MIIEDLTDARILVELQRRSSYAEAARCLKLPPATLSRRVMQMEDRAGVLLFKRSTRAVSITDAGRLAAQRAERILAEAAAADDAIEHLRDAPSGEVRVSVPVILGQTLLAPVAAEYLSLYPDCQLTLDLADQPVGLIEDAVDVVIRVGPIRDEGLLAKPLGYAVASLFQRAGAAFKPEAAADLAKCDLALLHAGPFAEPHLPLINDAGKQHFEPVTPRLVSMNPWLLMELALASDTVVVLPDIVAQVAVHAGALQRVLPDHPVRREKIQLAFASRRLLRPSIRAFIDLAAKRLPKALGGAQPSGP
ncbi:MAG: LysR family transcriptional regulator, partial [Pseudomonadota bacterium]